MREHGQSDVDVVLLSVGCLLSEHYPLGLGLLELVANPTTVPRVLGIGHLPAFVFPVVVFCVCALFCFRRCCSLLLLSCLFVSSSYQWKRREEVI